MMIIPRRSPNWNTRPEGDEPRLIVIHGTAGKTDAGDLAWCRDPKSRVSYHYLVGRDGTVYRLVSDEHRAWHAGLSSWNGIAGVNDYSIGIGICNRGDGEAYTQAQYLSAAGLSLLLMQRWPITLERIVGHCHVSPGRKSDPWLYFDWMRLAALITRKAA